MADFSAVTVDFSAACGKVKAMNCVNNGPFGSGRKNDALYAAAHFPFARNHDAAFEASYGLEYTVDVVNVFRNFDADENDPASYDFRATDVYIARTFAAGTTTYYRLGNKIEHGKKKYGVLPPKDFRKWARICEHIIAHYVEGFADGYTYDMPYWEIWNEYDCFNADGTSPCWSGTFEEFYDFFEIAAKHLKARFPKLKIGGPAQVGAPSAEAENFIRTMCERQVPLDFYSFHHYTPQPHSYADCVRGVRALLDKYGYTGAEIHLNEWNYVEGWAGEAIKRTYRTIPSMKGAAFVATAMLDCLYAPLDLFMYYDARPCGFNGLFGGYPSGVYKPYYAFIAFDVLRSLGTLVNCESDDESIVAAAATDGENGAVMLAYYAMEADAPAKDVKIAPGRSAKQAEWLLLDEAHDLVPVQVDTLNGTEDALYAVMKPNSVYLVRLTR